MEKILLGNISYCPLEIKDFTTPNIKRTDGLMTYKEFLGANPQFMLMSSIAFNPYSEYVKYLKENNARPETKLRLPFLDFSKTFDINKKLLC